MAVTLYAMVSTSTSKIYTPGLDYTESVQVPVMTSSSTAIPPTSFPQGIGMRMPALRSTSRVRRALVYARQAVVIEASVARTQSEMHRPNFRIGNGWILSVKKSTSTSDVFGPALNLGEPEIIEVTPLTSISRIINAELKYNINDMFTYNDDVYLLIRDREGNFKVYRGLVRNKNPKDRRIQVKAILGEGILSERIVKQDYDAQDVGLTVKQIIETYCSPLTAEGVKTNTGYFAPIQAKNKTALRVLENIRREYGLFYFVGYDWDFNLYEENDIGSENLEIQLGD